MQEQKALVETMRIFFVPLALRDIWEARDGNISIREFSYE